MRRLLWVALLCLLLPASWAATPNVVQGLEYAPIGGHADLVRVDLKQPLARSPAEFRTFHPAAHIVLDFADTLLAAETTSVDIDSKLVRSIRLLQQGSRTRLMIRLNAAADYQMEREGNHLRVTLRPSPRPAPATRFQRFDTAAAPAHRIVDVGFQRGASGAGVVLVRLSDPAAAPHLDRQGRHLILDFANAGVASGKQLRLDVQDFATPVYTVETRAAGGNARIAIETGSDIHYLVMQSGALLSVAVLPVIEEERFAVMRFR